MAYWILLLIVFGLITGLFAETTHFGLMTRIAGLLSIGFFLGLIGLLFFNKKD